MASVAGNSQTFSICRFAVSPRPNNSKKRTSRASGSRLICFPTARPLAEWHPRASLGRGVLLFVVACRYLLDHVQIAVTQVVADHQLVFAHLRQHGSHRVPKGV